ncbi:MAG TPA: metal-dependent hydrolase [Candidatus Dormibacteraeota bacterium]|nr:metal-dependent hydrolase [Candidatus Dormibacteraeota bacterium]
MDPITHGITGALLGKGLFSKREAKVAIFAATLGAIFPDIDMVAEVVSHDPLAIVKYHRSITHSFVAMPFFAMLLAALTPPVLKWLKRRYASLKDWEAPSFWMLTLIYAVGISSHIILDGMTSFGTRMWYPISSVRVAWDMLFIVDFAFMAVILAPQVAAWIYRDPARSRRRAIRSWILFAVGAFLIWAIARPAGYGFHLWVAALASAIFALLFFGPSLGGIGFRISRAAWCQAGLVVMVAYLSGAGYLHHAAYARAAKFASQTDVAVDRMGALPIPPSFLDWDDAIRAHHGVYESQFDLRNTQPLDFRFVPDSPPDPFIASAFKRPEVQLFWNFARFPSIVSFDAKGKHVVEIGENRYSDGRRRGAQPFTYELIYDPNGTLLAEGWLTNGVLRQHLQRVISPRPASADSQKAAK